MSKTIIVIFMFKVKQYYSRLMDRSSSGALRRAGNEFVKAHKEIPSTFINTGL